MKPTRMTIGKKIGSGFGVVLVLLIAVASLTYTGVGHIVDHADELITGKKIDGMISAKEADHLEWIINLTDLFVHNNVEKLKVQTDHRKCGLGKWLYGEERKEAERVFPQIAPLLKDIEKPHAELHASADKIKKLYDLEAANHANKVKAIAAKKWERISQDFFSTLDTAMEEVIDPAKYKAEESRNVEEMIKWSEIDMVMNEAVIAPFLNLCVTGARLSEGDIDERWSAYKDQLKKVLEGVQGWKNLVQNENVLTNTVEKITGQIDSFNKVINEYHQAVLEANKANESIQAAKNLFENETMQTVAAVQNIMHKIREEIKGHVITDEAMLTAVQTTRRNGMVVAGLAIIVGIILAIFISRGIIKSISRVIEGLKQSADQVASASGQVSSSSQFLAEGTSQQAASIEETSSSMEEMTSMTRKTAENSKQADDLTREANTVVDEANQSMKSLTNSMTEISHASEETSKIIKTIDEIAFQTNLLALNAAVEAARAGEAGAGFAVVADEVRNLAMRAAEAARSTATLIEDTVKKVNEGAQLVTDTDASFSRVAQSTAQVGELVAEIAEASNEQSRGIEQVNIAISEMDKVVQQNAANAEESASASEEMSAQAGQLNVYVGDLLSLVTGSRKASHQDVSAKPRKSPIAKRGNGGAPTRQGPGPETGRPRPAVPETGGKPGPGNSL